MQERDQLSLGSHPRLVVNQCYSSGPAAVECGLQIVDLEADVMYCRPTAGDEFPNRRIVVYRLEQLDDRTARVEATDSRSVHGCQLPRLHPEDVSIKWKDISDRADCNADVGNSDALGG